MSVRERGWAKEILTRLQSGSAKGLDIKKLKGREDIFRVRKGDVRIIYQLRDGGIFVLAIDRRNEKTYRGL